MVSTKDLAIYHLQSKITNTKENDERKFYEQQLHDNLNVSMQLIFL